MQIPYANIGVRQHWIKKWLGTRLCHESIMKKMKSKFGSKCTRTKIQHYLVSIGGTTIYPIVMT